MSLCQILSSTSRLCRDTHQPCPFPLRAAAAVGGARSRRGLPPCLNGPALSGTGPASSGTATSWRSMPRTVSRITSWRSKRSPNLRWRSLIDGSIQVNLSLLSGKSHRGGPGPLRGDMARERAGSRAGGRVTAPSRHGLIPESRRCNRAAASRAAVDDPRMRSYARAGDRAGRGGRALARRSCALEPFP